MIITPENRIEGKNFYNVTQVLDKFFLNSIDLETMEVENSWEILFRFQSQEGEKGNTADFT